VFVANCSVPERWHGTKLVQSFLQLVHATPLQ
jgi:hypothetical protein